MHIMQQLGFEPTKIAGDSSDLLEDVNTLSIGRKKLLIHN